MRVEPISAIELDRLKPIHPAEPRKDWPQRQPHGQNQRQQTLADNGQPPAPPPQSVRITLSIAGIAAVLDERLSKRDFAAGDTEDALFYAGVRRDLPKLAAAGITALEIDRHRSIVRQVAEKLVGLPDDLLPAIKTSIGPDHPLFQPARDNSLLSLESVKLQAETRLHQQGEGPAPHRVMSTQARAAMAAYGRTLSDLGEMAGLPGAGVVPPLPQEKSMEVEALRSLLENLAALSKAGISQVRLNAGDSAAAAIARRAASAPPAGLDEIKPLRR